MYIAGDHHGNWKFLKNLISELPVNSNILHVGDYGVGFDSDETEEWRLERFNSYLSDKNITLYVVRGNHDHPKYFQGNHIYSHLKLLPDYTILEIEKLKVLFVGGAISIDRIHRTENIDWWRGEKFEYRELDLPEVDLMISHMAPEGFPPYRLNSLVEYYIQQGSVKVEELTKERVDLRKIYDQVKPKALFCGHYHMSHQIQDKDCYFRILNIEEVYEFNRSKD